MIWCVFKLHLKRSDVTDHFRDPSQREKKDFMMGEGELLYLSEERKHLLVTPLLLSSTLSLSVFSTQLTFS